MALYWILLFSNLLPLYIHFQARFRFWKTCFAHVLLNISKDAKDKRADSYKVATKLGARAGLEQAQLRLCKLGPGTVLI